MNPKPMRGERLTNNPTRVFPPRLLVLSAHFAPSMLLMAMMTAASAFAANVDGMAHIPSGEYRPLYAESDADGGALEGATTVGDFYLDADAATNDDFLAFVRARPRWQKSQARAVFVDANYLSHWRDDLSPGARAQSSAPVVNVSWFAARAYCKWRGKTLPSVAQWEYAAMADETSAFAARDDDSFRQRMMEWYANPAGLSTDAPAHSFENLHGVRDMHGLIWEWTSDFNNALVTGASRSDSGGNRNLFCGGAALGAVDFSDYAAFMRFAFRSSLRGNYTVSSLGFRCASPGRGI